jgi:hypothetical protein
MSEIHCGLTDIVVRGWRSCALEINVNIVVSQHNMDFIKPEPDPGGLEFQSSAPSEHQVTDVKHEEPALINCQLVKNENEVSCMI